MTSPILPGSMIYIGDKVVRTRMYAMARRPGDPQSIVGTFTIEDTDGVLTLDALQGPQGIPGIPSPIILPQWGHGYSTATQMKAAEHPGPGDAGKAWYIGGFWHIWTGTEWRQEQGSLEGPPGPTPDMSMTAELVAPLSGGPYGTVVVERSGPDADPHFHLKIPGIVGPQGDNATIRDALDFDGSVDPLDGQGIVWNETKNKFEPGDLSPYGLQMWTIPQGAFNGDSYNTPEQIIAQLSIEAQPVAWWADVSGHVKWRRGLLSSAGIQIEVRIEPDVGTPSVPGSAPVFGVGPFDPSTLDTTTVTNIGAHFSTESEPMRAVSPTSEVGRIPANQACTVWVLARRISGGGSYTIDASYSQVVIRGFPVS